MLADKLNMSPEEAERWIVNLIRNARLDAKIDSKLVRPAVIFLNQLPQYLMNESNSLGSSDSHITLLDVPPVLLESDIEALFVS